MTAISANFNTRSVAPAVFRGHGGLLAVVACRRTVNRAPAFL
jgi:hypothetical protein